MALFAIFGLCGCTQYNGYIGPIFGSWALMEISEDGLPLTMDEETVFSFQNQVVQVIKRAEPPFPSAYRYGNFVKTDDTLTLKFQTSPTESGSQMYMTPDWLHFPADEMIIVMDIKKLDSKEMVLDLISGPSHLQYRFARTW